MDDDLIFMKRTKILWYNIVNLKNTWSVYNE